MSRILVTAEVVDSTDPAGYEILGWTPESIFTYTLGLIVFIGLLLGIVVAIEKFYGMVPKIPRAFVEPRGVLVYMFVFMLASNARMLAGTYGVNNKILSSQNPTYATPDPYTFSIAWRVIYPALLVFVIRQYTSGPEESERVLSRKSALTSLDVRNRMIIAFIANALWLPLFTDNSLSAVITAQLCVLVYVVALCSVYTDVNVQTTRKGFDRFFLAVPIALSCAWSIAAFMVGFTLMLKQFGWETNGAGASPEWGLAICVFFIALGVYRTISANEGAFTLVLSWALFGLARSQQDADSPFPEAARSPVFGSTAFSGGCLLLVATLYGGVRQWLASDPADPRRQPLTGVEMRA
jgi:hypothetical protein